MTTTNEDVLRAVNEVHNKLLEAFPDMPLFTGVGPLPDGLLIPGSRFYTGPIRITRHPGDHFEFEVNALARNRIGICPRYNGQPGRMLAVNLI